MEPQLPSDICMIELEGHIAWEIAVLLIVSLMFDKVILTAICAAGN